MTPSIIFDFDGTLAIGHGPVLAYARLLAPSAAPGFLERVEAELLRYDNGAPDFRDGYNIVASLGAADRIPEATMAAAYTNSRAQLGTAQAPVESMPELKAFLSALGQHAHLVLATNAPGEGVDRVLANWNVQDRFDEQHFNVGKPAGLYNIIESALDRGPVLAIGDIAEYDLAPALELGADTALVGATATTSTAPVTMRGASLEHITSDIQTWAAQAAHHSDTASTFSER